MNIDRPDHAHCRRAHTARIGEEEVVTETGSGGWNYLLTDRAVRAASVD